MVNPLFSRPILRLCLLNPSPFPKQSTPTTPLQVWHFSTTHSSSSPPSYPYRRLEEESRAVRVSVWWDFENCGLPNGANVFKVAPAITAAVRANGIKGAIQITAFGDVLQLSRANQEALSSTGVNLTHVPHGGKNSADRSLLVDLMYWVSQNPPPAHLFLISGDRDFASILHRLRMNNYNILLASPESAPGVLCSAASITWQWNALLRGENLTGKHFNQPPDGPYGSWYGHYRGPLDDPFAANEQSSCPRREELSDSGPDAKIRPIPKSIVKQIRQILCSYPKGIPITELRSELAKSNVDVDKEFYGYKKFSRFLLAMPEILRLQSANDGQFLIRGVRQKVPEENEFMATAASGPVSNSERDSVGIPNLNDEKRSYTEPVDEKLSLPSFREPRLSGAPTRLQEPKVHELPKPYTAGVGEKLSPLPSPEPKAESLSRLRDLRDLQEPTGQAQKLPRGAQESSPLVQGVGNDDLEKRQLHAAEEYSFESEHGIFRTIWKKWFGGKDGFLKDRKDSTEADKLLGQKLNSEEKEVKLDCHSAESMDSPSDSPASKPITVDHFAERSEATFDKTGSPNIFSKIMSWLRFWRSSQDSGGSCEDSRGKTNAIKLGSSSKLLFSKDSFWNEMRSFLDTPQGSTLVLQSKTRVQMAHNLRKHGPSVLGSLFDDDLLQLVDSLISDKKWVEECVFLTFPFKLTESAGKDSSKRDASPLHGLSSVFLDAETHSNSLKNQEPIGDQYPHTGVTHSVYQGKASGKTRNETLSDCQKLVEFIVKEYPQGFNMGSFRRLFLERNGYPLEIQKLGYQKLATLLHIMPGIRVEYTHIFPAGKGITSPGCAGEDNAGLLTKLNHGLSGVSRKDDDIESPWEELGPIADADSKKEMDAGLDKAAKGRGEEHHEYELLSEDNFSDSDEETLSPTKSEEDTKQHGEQAEDKSSLLQILDAWYGSKEGTNGKDKNGKDKSEIDNSLGDSINNNSASSASSGMAAKNETAMSNYGGSKRLSKSYSFVAEQRADDKDKLIEGILGSFKRSTESRI